MSRRKGKRPYIPQPSRLSTDLSKPNIGTGPTVAIPETHSETGTAPPAGEVYQIPRDYLGEAPPDRFAWLKGSTRPVIEVIALGIMVGTVVVSAGLLLFGVSNLNGSVEQIGDDVDRIESVSNQNTIRLDALNSSVDDIKRGVDNTRDLVNELRIQDARRRTQDDASRDRDPDANR